MPAPEDAYFNGLSRGQQNASIYIPAALSGIAVLHLGGRFVWHFCWEYAYAWRIWKRYKAALAGDDSKKVNRMRHYHVFMEAAFDFFARLPNLIDRKVSGKVHVEA